MGRIGIVVSALALVATACASANSLDDGSPAPQASSSEVDQAGTLEQDLAALLAAFGPSVSPSLVDAVASHGDLRAAWFLADLMRFYDPESVETVILAAGVAQLGLEADPRDPWTGLTNQLIDADIAEPPGYKDLKVGLLVSVDARWGPLLAGDTSIDFRLISWGGVFIDDRPVGAAGSCFGRGCIPALEFPDVTPAAEGAWYSDDAIVFGVVVDGEARAYQKNIMEVHEMVNDVLGGRRIGIPYCTLCGSAQAYFTDVIDGVRLGSPLVLRTTGLLSRSNKVMYDLASKSVFDTFTGEARSGQLFREGAHLTQISVRVATWGEWRSAHPETTIIAPDGGVGRIYPEDPLFGRDDDGPIFPVGTPDERLGPQVAVVGVVAPDGSAVAFVAEEARLVLGRGGEVMSNGVVLASDGGGLIAFAVDGSPLVAHESFWFAWSQFWPETGLWPAP
jgi:hypothetical protein